MLVSLWLTCAAGGCLGRPALRVRPLRRQHGRALAAGTGVHPRHAVYYACWLPKRKRTRLGIEAENSLPETSGGVSTPVHVNGQYVVWAIEGVAEGGEEAIVFALNARTGRIVHELEVPAARGIRPRQLGHRRRRRRRRLARLPAAGGQPMPGQPHPRRRTQPRPGARRLRTGQPPPRARLRSRQRPRILDHAPARGRADGELDPRGGPPLGHASLSSHERLDDSRADPRAGTAGRVARAGGDPRRRHRAGAPVAARLVRRDARWQPRGRGEDAARDPPHPAIRRTSGPPPPSGTGFVWAFWTRRCSTAPHRTAWTSTTSTSPSSATPRSPCWPAHWRSPSSWTAASRSC